VANSNNTQEMHPLSEIEKGTVELLETLEAEKTKILPASTIAQQLQNIKDFEVWYDVKHLEYKILREDIYQHTRARILEGRDDDSPEVSAIWKKVEKIQEALGEFEKMLRR
jgi:hypothetical protein